MKTLDRLIETVPAGKDAADDDGSEKLLTWGPIGPLVGIAAILAIVIVAFAYLGCWLTPDELTPMRFVDALEQVDGVHSGYRRNHAKGLGASGYFDSNGAGTRLSRAAVFERGQIPVIARFSLSGGQPGQVDKASTVRGLAVEFPTSDGEIWRTAMVNLPVFPVATPEAFYERMLAAKADPQTGQVDPAKMAAFLAKYPEAKQAMAVIKAQPTSSGFANSTFHGLNAFHFVNSEGQVTPVRWILSPLQEFESASDLAQPSDHDYLFHSLVADVKRQPLKWRLVVIVGEPGDPTDNASIPWPDSRAQIEVGTLTLDTTYNEHNDPASNINFDPLVLPSGIEPSNDPLLSARSAVYSQSYTRRETEKAFADHQ